MKKVYNLNNIEKSQQQQRFSFTLNRFVRKYFVPRGLCMKPSQKKPATPSRNGDKCAKALTNLMQSPLIFGQGIGGTPKTH